jgi:two-component system sensor histidine kinase QseC
MKRLSLPSLQARLLVPLLVLVAVIWLGAAVATGVDTRHELDELLDGHLAQAAALLVVQQTSPGDDDDVADAPSLHKYAPKVAFQMFHEGQLVMRSANAGLTPMSMTTSGFDTVRLEDGTQWRVFGTRGAERDVQVYVGEQTSSRSEILWVVLRGMLWPLGVALPLLAIAGWWAVRQGLAPVRRLSHELAQRQAQTLERVTLGDMPSEMRPLIQALNDLFDRIEHMIVAERRFTADAAHELRTPIAAIRAQAQVAMGAGDDDAQRSHALQSTLAGCDRATHLVEQLLTLARLESGSSAPANTVNLNATVRRVAADLAGAALARHQRMALDAADTCPISGDETLVAVLVRNLIDNAIRYTPQGGQIQISVLCESGHAILRVEDSGPGMTTVDAVRLGERFFRVLGTNETGSGLGWSIVKRIAQASDAQVQTSHSELLGGLAVSITWSRPTPI